MEAQNPESETANRLNSNAGFMVGVPVSQTAQYATISWGLTYGVGYNISKRHALIGEVLWNSLYPTSSALAPIRAASHNNNITGHGNLVALTANYRLQFQGKTFGTYIIGGGGMYYRQASLSQQVTTGESVTCNPAVLWWGFSCSSGVVTANQSITSSSSVAPGGNVGIGFTAAIPDSRYSFYVEARYQYAPNKGVATQFVPITVGVRF